MSHISFFALWTLQCKSLKFTEMNPNLIVSHNIIYLFICSFAYLFIRGKKVLLWFGNPAKQECTLCLYLARFLSEYPKNVYHFFEHAMGTLLVMTCLHCVKGGPRAHSGHISYLN